MNTYRNTSRSSRESRSLEPAPTVLVALSSLTAEGTPRLALELSRVWREQGIRPVVVLLRPTPDDLAPDFAALGVQQVCLRIADHGFRRYGRLAFEFCCLARRHRADALLSMPFGWHAFMAWGARLGGVRRVVVHVGNYPTMEGAAFRKFRTQVQIGRPATTTLVCCSRYVQEGVLRRFAVRAEETAVVYNGVPVATLAERALRARGRRSAGPFRIGMVARLEPHKDQRTLIHSASLLAEADYQTEVWLIGDGTRRAEYEALIEALGLKECVRLLGMRRDVPELLGQLDLFVFSTTADEGLGVALTEAMATGVPVVATDVGACREVLDEGDLGVLVPPEHPRALAQAIVAVMHDPHSARARAERAQAKAAREFDVASMARAYAKLLGLEARH